MSDFLLYASVVALFLVCILVVLVILMQRPSANAGMGAALGGGAAEIILFVLSFGLYLGFVAREKPSVKALDAAATAAPAAPAAAAAAAPAAPAPVAAPVAKPQSTPAPAASTPVKPAAPAPAK